MSASGKTTIGKKLYEKLKYSKEKWIFLDGDNFRNILADDLGHTIEDRKKNAYRITRFCQFLNNQNINVIASVLSIFHENQIYNKNNIKDYKEVYLDVNLNKLINRDNKDLYKKALNGEIKNVVGVDIPFKPPISPDLIINNNDDNPDYQKIIQKIINFFKIKIDNNYIYGSKNLLNFPNTYQYSEYQGSEFLKIFMDYRKLKLKFFKERFKKINSQNYKIVKLKDREYKNKKDLILKNFLIYLYNLDLDKIVKYQNSIYIIIKRFEVTKKLYLTYDLENYTKTSSKYDEYLNYPLFSLVLQKYFRITNNQQKLVFLNTILKVNDIISSIASDFIMLDENYFSKIAIQGELEIIKEYIK